MQKIGCPEAFTDPKDIYKIARKKGLNAITITDHDQINGCLEILEYPNTFISSEVAVRFPEDGCKIHLLTYDISENQFKEILELRQNIYELSEYLRNENIYHAVAHPLSAVNDKLKQEHFEKMMLLF